jgi:putative toxin-antitoxin system antitoxin component (TIGR02293 family)
MRYLLREASPRYRRRTDFWRKLSSLLELKRPVYRSIDLAHALGEGLALAALDALVREGYLQPAEVSLVAPARTLTHRRARGERLRPDESERVARIGKVVLYAEQVFGDKARALKWLHAPKRRLGGRTPFQLLATAEGAQVVEEELVAIDEGYVA